MLLYQDHLSVSEELSLVSYALSHFLSMILQPSAVVIDNSNTEDMVD